MNYHVIWMDKDQFKIQGFQNKDAAYLAYNKIQISKCIMAQGLVLQAVAGKKCIGYGIQKNLLKFFSKKYRIVYFDKNYPKQIKNIDKQEDAIKEYDNLGSDITKCLIKQSKILRKNGKNNQDYTLLAELIYINQEDKKFGMKILKLEKPEILKLQGKCKKCGLKKAVIVQLKCSHLIYCEDCDKSKASKACLICNEVSQTLKINI